MTTDIFLRSIALLCITLRYIYWLITEKKADKEKQKMRAKLSLFEKDAISKYFMKGSHWLLIAQLIGLRVFPFPQPSVSFQMIGLGIVTIGVGIGILARYQLGVNWTNSYDFQIKKDHKLVTHGIYHYIRHPIYTGLILVIIGGELVAQSYLFFVSVFFFIGGYWQAKREERLLLANFGKEYGMYMKLSKMFIPFVW